MATKPYRTTDATSPFIPDASTTHPRSSHLWTGKHWMAPSHQRFPHYLMGQRGISTPDAATKNSSRQRPTSNHQHSPSTPHVHRQRVAWPKRSATPPQGHWSRQNAVSARLRNPPLPHSSKSPARKRSPLLQRKSWQTTQKQKIDQTTVAPPRPTLSKRSSRTTTKTTTDIAPPLHFSATYPSGNPDDNNIPITNPTTNDAYRRASELRSSWQTSDPSNNVYITHSKTNDAHNVIETRSNWWLKKPALNPSPTCKYGFRWGGVQTFSCQSL